MPNRGAGARALAFRLLHRMHAHAYLLTTRCFQHQDFDNLLLGPGQIPSLHLLFLRGGRHQIFFLTYNNEHLLLVLFPPACVGVGNL